MASISVDLPAPFGPMMPCSTPRDDTSSVTSLSACTLPYATVRFSTRNIYFLPRPRSRPNSCSTKPIAPFGNAQIMKTTATPVSSSR